MNPASPSKYSRVAPRPRRLRLLRRGVRRFERHDLDAVLESVRALGCDSLTGRQAFYDLGELVGLSADRPLSLVRHSRRVDDEHLEAIALGNERLDWYDD